MKGTTIITTCGKFIRLVYKLKSGDYQIRLQTRISIKISMENNEVPLNRHPFMSPSSPL